MQTYNLKTVSESRIVNGSVSTNYYSFPVDTDGNAITDYSYKFRAFVDDQMIIFDSEQEYNDYINNNL